MKLGLNVKIFWNIFEKNIDKILPILTPNTTIYKPKILFF
jgi:hypothetical protein